MKATQDRVTVDVAQAFLAILMPARTVLNQCINEFQQLYEAAARRLEEDGQQPGGGGRGEE